MMTPARILGAPSAIPPITGLTADSRAVRPGFLFAALPGSRTDGRAFIADAVARGAAVVLAPEDISLPAGAEGVSLITDADPRRRFALLAAAFHGAQPAQIAAVTGTNGKTSTSHFTRQIWEKLGLEAAALGTLGVTTKAGARPGALTTPDPATLHEILADLAGQGIDHLAMEASSHGLEQRRLDGVMVHAAGFTNLSRDHLDYHGDMATYLAAKTRLFTEILQPDGIAVLNADAPESAGIAAAAQAAGRQTRLYGHAGDWIRLDERRILPHGQTLALTIEDRPFKVDLPLAGGFQAMNALLALGLAMALGADRDRAVAALADLTGVRGRLELVATTREGAGIYVDYAHTPDALETVLAALRPHARRELAVVFGCGGDRDRGKRPLMGEVAARLADKVIVTDDNPRTENATAIRQEVLAGCPGAREIGDRGEAIATAVAELENGDVLVIAGKGHETGQIIGHDVRPFDDAERARKAALALTSKEDQ